MSTRSGKYPWWKSAIAGVLLVGVGIGAGFAWDRSSAAGRSGSLCRENLIDPVVCSGEASEQVSYLAFRHDLEEYLESAKRSGKITDAGIYFRDLRNGPTLELNANDPFLTMSLMKMPLMVSILKYAETHPGVLDEKVRTPSEFAMNVQVMKQAETLVPDREYTVDELLRFLISYSDNRALGVLLRWFDGVAGQDAIADTLVDIGIMRPQDTLPDTTVSPRAYAAILRILYTAAYLNPEHSQRALEYLTGTTFDDGITRDIPEGVRVAHKFGVNDDGVGDVQLHDCGIVYHPGGPYILCVMTKGGDYGAQARYVQDVASRVYDHVTAEGLR